MVSAYCTGRFFFVILHAETTFLYNITDYDNGHAPIREIHVLP